MPAAAPSRTFDTAPDGSCAGPARDPLLVPMVAAGAFYLIAAMIDTPPPAPRVTDRPGVQPKAA